MSTPAFDYVLLKKFELVLPAFTREPIRAFWRRMRGNPEIRIARHLCDPHRVALDIGASMGDFSEALADRAKGCVAFEANPNTSAMLAKRLRKSNLQVHACALSDREAEVKLLFPVVNHVDFLSLATVEPDNNMSGHETKSITVPCRTLDSFDLPPVGFIKIDVEGHEIAVLKGARSLIERDQPNFLIEVEERHKPGAVKAVSSFFMQLGYQGFFLLGRRLHPLTEFDQALHQASSSISLSKVLPGRVYANNFVFVTDVKSLNGLLGRSL
ncbi:MAG TPA: FkbM family methyltransferase [Burkholderiales bacterium]|jgi:FkbM family methyltransferase|nr:FkbM family methyltransferase [Burkholderiales bacterium]